jgi:class 3 adenylate cyclase/TolB-like protein
MAELAANRRLAAILAADIAGYSRLMEEDEAATVRDLKGHQAVVLPLVAHFGGRIIDTAGDGILAEFSSVIHAVECAVEIQRTMAERNRDVPERRRMQFRIGINIGDVLHDDARIYGDGINIAARLEGIARPGGICVSSKVRDELGSRMPLEFHDLGVQHLKNIERDVHAFAIELDAPAPPTSRPLTVRNGISRSAIAGAIITIAVVLAVTFAGDVRNSIARLWNRSSEGLASRPFRSLVILPVQHASNEELALAQGLTEDLTNAAGRAFPDGLVISSGLAAKYRGTQDVRTVGRDLNVRYVVETRLVPSASGTQLYVAVIDSVDGGQVWAANQPIAAPGDTVEPIAKIQNGLRNAVADVTKREIQLLPEKQRAAWMLVSETWGLAHSIEDDKKGQKLLEEALRLNPDFVPAMLSLANSLWVRIQDEPERRDEFLKRMDEITLRATQVAPRDPRAWMYRERGLAWQGNVAGALTAGDEALRLDPFKGSLLMQRAATLNYVGRPADSLPLIDRALVLDPTLKGDEQIWKCVAYLNLGRDKDAVAPCEAAAALFPYWTLYGCAAAAHAAVGNMERAVYWRKKLMEANPQLTVQRWRSVRYSPLPESIAQFDRWLSNLTKAGVPEK